MGEEKNDNISQKSPEVEIFKETTVLVEEEGESQGVQPKIENPAEKPRGGRQRQSERLKQQGLNHVKTTDKAEALTMKKNLEGNIPSSKNSFAVLSNNELMIRSHLMGVEVNGIELESFYILKDLEKGKSNLLEKNNMCWWVILIILLSPWRT